jgi:hypothetical protein
VMTGDGECGARCRAGTKLRTGLRRLPLRQDKGRAGEAFLLGRGCAARGASWSAGNGGGPPGAAAAQRGRGRAAPPTVTPALPRRPTPGGIERQPRLRSRGRRGWLVSPAPAVRRSPRRRRREADRTWCVRRRRPRRRPDTRHGGRHQRRVLSGDPGTAPRSMTRSPRAAVRTIAARHHRSRLKRGPGRRRSWDPASSPSGAGNRSPGGRRDRGPARRASCSPSCRPTSSSSTGRSLPVAKPQDEINEALISQATSGSSWSG